MPSRGFDIYVEEALRYRNYYENPRMIGEVIRRIVERYVGNVKVYIFGSIVRGRYTAASDIDVLIVTPSKLSNEEVIRLKVAIVKEVDAPIEIHIASVDEFERWYRKFIPKEEILEV